jgi:endonuclease III
MAAVDIPSIFKILKHEFDTHRMPVIDLIGQERDDPFRVLVGTILSARTKDQTTAQACQRLFAAINTPEDLAALGVKRIERLIYPVGFYQNKARFLKKLPTVLNTLYGGRIPDTIEELIMLPGVGRKTANLVVAIGFHKPAICVDVHVHRITNRLGYVATQTPFETEMALRAKLAQRYWIMFNSYLVSFGQHTCLPRLPRCGKCPIRRYCNRIGVKSRLKTP